MAADSSSSTGFMRSWLKYLLFGVLAFASCWCAAITYWRTTQRIPANWEIAVYLLGLPLFLLLGLWLGLNLFTRKSSSASTIQLSTTKPAQTPPATDVAILAVALRTPFGASSEELAAAIAANKARPNLDPELVDDEGFPVMTARSSDAVDTALQAEITLWLEQNGMSVLNFNAEQWRALILATAVTRELVCTAADEFGYQEGSRPKLRLAPILPNWPSDHRRAAAEWLRKTATTLGWPNEDTCVDEDLLDEAAAAPILDSFGRKDAAIDKPSLLMVVAFASNIGEETVGNWAANKTLFTSSRTNGAIPGEGAAGLLLCEMDHARQIMKDNFVCLGAMNDGRLGSSADGMKRVDPRLMSELIEVAIKRGLAEFTDVVKIVADTDHRPNRMLELMGCASAVMPKLDGTEDIVQVGIATGCSGGVPFITALALARHHALGLRAPVLVVSNADAYRRMATLVRPAGDGMSSSVGAAS